MLLLLYGKGSIKRSKNTKVDFSTRSIFKDH